MAAGLLHAIPSATLRNGEQFQEIVAVAAGELHTKPVFTLCNGEQFQEIVRNRSR